MQNIFAVMSTVFKLLQVELYFPPFSFTLLEFFLALSVGFIIAGFVRKFFD